MIPELHPSQLFISKEGPGPVEQEWHHKDGHSLMLGCCTLTKNLIQVVILGPTHLESCTVYGDVWGRDALTYLLKNLEELYLFVHRCQENSGHILSPG